MSFADKVAIGRGRLMTALDIEGVLRVPRMRVIFTLALP